jgi:hypothetical protein
MPLSAFHRPWRALAIVSLCGLSMLGVHVFTRWAAGQSIFLSHAGAAGRLDQVRLELQTLRVREYRNLDWCRTLRVEDVAYMQSSHASTCLLSADRAEAFDARAQAQHAQVAALFQATGINVVGFSGVLDATGAYEMAEVTIDGCPFCRIAYEYRAPRQPQPRNVPNELEYERVSPCWYRRVEDWN